jgi:hypothetical protein
MGRDKKFSEPMPLPKGKKLATLRDDLTYAACRLSRCETRTCQHVRSAVASSIKRTTDSKASHRLDKPLARSKKDQV